MIELKNLTKKYGAITAVNDLSLTIKREDTTVFAGPSGSGKTTLFRLIAGLETPDAGEIFINRQKASTRGRIIIPPNKRGLGMIFQDLALWPHMTVQENLEFGLKSQGIKKTERKEKIENVLNIIKLNGHLNRYPCSLSGGEKQRVALARTLVLKPEIILMDEPLASLDTVLKDELQDMIIRLVKRLNILLLYVTHNREEALAIGTNIVVMSDGSIVQSGNINNLMENPKTDFVKRFIRRA
ncbi:MAG: ABC transporter ATP-binding protein [Desulfobacteraceae bacterium]|nr:ABC transporter ATP-binding protein [Desulfobacteraceae bacterium]